MLPSYSDIKDQLGEPDWWDQHGVPRYGEFHPEKVTIYSKTVALYVLGCQGCEEQLRVAWDYKDPFHWEKMGLKEKYGGPPDTDPVNDKEGWDAWEIKLEESMVPERFAFGDPPRHGCQGAGETMGSWTLACEQWWVREDFEWGRVTDYEKVVAEDYASWSVQLGLEGENPHDILHHLAGVKEEEDVPLEDL